MTAPTEHQILADTGGLLVTDDGRRVLVIDRCTGALAIAAFVLGVRTLVVGGFGLVALIAGAPSGRVPTWYAILLSPSVRSLLRDTPSRRLTLRTLEGL